MPTHDEVRRLTRKWTSGTGWPKRLEWLRIRGIRGWSDQRIDFHFPIIAIAGENGSGKSTLLQAAASVYRPLEENDPVRFPSEFFPDTAWDQIRDASIHYGYREGPNQAERSIRKPTTRWLGHSDRPKRAVTYVDLSRIQPVGARVGYARIAKNRHQEKSSSPFDTAQVERLSAVMGRNYDSARMALSTLDDNRLVPVIAQHQKEYSGFHQGSGENMVTELLKTELPRNGLVLIDEIESSLHPRAQRRLIRDLAEQCRQREAQIILTTHSPYILEELPPDARTYILESAGSKEIVRGVSPEFALTKMDDDVHPECDLYVEDNAAKVMLAELLAYHAKELFQRCAIVPFGTVDVGQALGKMVLNHRFPRRSLVFLDGDAGEAQGCLSLPGGDAPERVVFTALRAAGWGHLWTRVARDISAVMDACNNAMTLNDHHDWVRVAANHLMCGGDTLWQAMCAEWAKDLLQPTDAQPIVQAVTDLLP